MAFTSSWVRSPSAPTTPATTKEPRKAAEATRSRLCVTFVSLFRGLAAGLSQSPEVRVDGGHGAVSFAVDPVRLRARRLQAGDLVVRERGLQADDALVEVHLEQ